MAEEAYADTGDIRLRRKHIITVRAIVTASTRSHSGVFKYIRLRNEDGEGPKINVLK
jgi:hypothetical protein